jgi:phosphatidylserine synthase
MHDHPGGVPVRVRRVATQDRRAARDCAILFVSALWMSRSDQETEDGWFNGFPAEWNMIIPTLFLLHPTRGSHWPVCVIFCG